MNICSNNFMGIYKIVGIFLYIFKFAIPFTIMIYGSIDLFIAVIKPVKEKMFKKIKTFIRRIILGIAIFFLPSIILYVFNSIGLDSYKYSCMYNCVLDLNCEQNIAEEEN